MSPRRCGSTSRTVARRRPRRPPTLTPSRRRPRPRRRVHCRSRRRLPPQPVIILCAFPCGRRSAPVHPRRRRRRPRRRSKRRFLHLRLPRPPRSRTYNPPNPFQLPRRRAGRPPGRAPRCPPASRLVRHRWPRRRGLFRRALCGLLCAPWPAGLRKDLASRHAPTWQPSSCSKLPPRRRECRSGVLPRPGSRSSSGPWDPSSRGRASRGRANPGLASRRLAPPV